MMERQKPKEYAYLLDDGLTTPPELQPQVSPQP